MKLHAAEILLVALTSLVTSCSQWTSPVAKNPPRLGMSNKQLLAEYGAPLKIKSHPDGSQDWTYRFATAEDSIGPDWDEPRYHAGGDVSKSVTFQKEVVHLSPAKEVTGNIPEGKIMRTD